MPAVEVQEIIALTLVFVVHVIGGVALVWAMLEEDTRAGWRRRWGFGGGPPDDEPRPVPPSPQPATEIPRRLPLAATDPSDVRLRGPRRLADAHPPAQRRPGHAPRPARTPH
ncbi:MAG TPA: hypothetical protein VMY78_02980 [Solirubrobacteraceae bacterium]|nr:hypothetical protein [Solirubrobacteraceae bacterium]